MPTDPLTPRQRQTLAARQALAQKFPSQDDRSAHYRALGQTANAARITLNADEVAALGEAYALLRRIAARHSGKINPSLESTDMGATR